MEFATRAKRIQNRARVNETLTSKELLQKYKGEVEELKEKLASVNEIEAKLEQAKVGSSSLSPTSACTADAARLCHRARKRSCFRWLKRRRRCWRKSRKTPRNCAIGALCIRALVCDCVCVCARVCSPVGSPAASSTWRRCLAGSMLNRGLPPPWQLCVRVGPSRRPADSLWPRCQTSASLPSCGRST